jgi:hypothetical protein
MMDGSIDTVEPDEGDFFEGVLLETCRDFRVTRPRVRPMGALPQRLRVEFPRHLREEVPIGTRFRARRTRSKEASSRRKPQRRRVSE